MIVVYGTSQRIGSFSERIGEYKVDSMVINVKIIIIYILTNIKKPLRTGGFHNHFNANWIPCKKIAILILNI